MLTIGLTGGIGSGKSTVAEIFEVLEVPVYYADKQAKSLLNKDETLQHQLKEAFGREVYDEQGRLDRQKLAGLVFNNPEALETLNAIVHPAVRKDFANRKANLAGYPYIIQEAALLYETGSFKHFDRMISVTAPKETRIKRIMDRDGMNRQDVLNRMANQLPQAQKDKQSDFVINNDGRHLVIPKVLAIHQRFSSSKKDRAQKDLNTD